jgi:hypothetical protein
VRSVRRFRWRGWWQRWRLLWRQWRWRRSRRAGISHDISRGSQIPRPDAHRDLLQRTRHGVPENLRVQFLRHASFNAGGFQPQLEHVCLDDCAAAGQYHKVFLRIQQHGIDSRGLGEFLAAASTQQHAFVVLQAAVGTIFHGNRSCLEYPAANRKRPALNPSKRRPLRTFTILLQMSDKWPDWPKSNPAYENYTTLHRPAAPAAG